MNLMIKKNILGKILLKISSFSSLLMMVPFPCFICLIVFYCDFKVFKYYLLHLSKSGSSHGAFSPPAVSGRCQGSSQLICWALPCLPTLRYGDPFVWSSLCESCVIFHRELHMFHFILFVESEAHP